MEPFCGNSERENPLTILVKNSVVEVGLGSKWASAFSRFELSIVTDRIKRSSKPFV